MKSSKSPTARSLEVLRDQGYTAQVVEHWNPHARIRQDLFGFIDIVVLKDGETLAIQACAGGSVAARIRKIADHPNLGAVRKAGWRIQVWGWRKVKVKRGGKATRWDCRTEDIS